MPSTLPAPYYVRLVFTHTIIAFNDLSGFVRTKNYDNLAGVLLAVTGCEAMFAKCV